MNNLRGIFPRYQKVLFLGPIMLFFFFLNVHSASAASCPVTDGGAGDGDATVNGVITIDANTTWTPTDATAWNCSSLDLHVTNNATLAFESDISNGYTGYLQVNNLTIDNGSSIVSDRKGCTNTGTGNGYGPNGSNVCTISTAGYGAGLAANTSGGGAGYGSLGGKGGVSGGTIYGDPTAPIYLGSSGGSADFGKGGKGGGVVRIEVGGDFTHNGAVSANGGDASGGDASHAGGGGSGGSIFITVTGDFAGSTGTFSSNGGNGYDGASFDGGGGAGGRIALIYATRSFSGLDSSDFSVNGGTGPDTATDGGVGTVYVKNSTNNTITIYHGFTFDDTDYSVSSWTVDPNATSLICTPSAATPSVSANNLTWAGTTNCTSSSLTSFNLSASSSFAISDGTNFTVTNESATVDFNVPTGNNQVWTNFSFTGPPEGNFTINDAFDLELAGTTSITSNINWSGLTALILGANASINANSLGCQSAGSDWGYAPNASNVCVYTTDGGAGRGFNANSSAGGGAHGGDGGDIGGGGGGVAYDSSTNPVKFGATGGNSTSSYLGGDGGGLVLINVSGDFAFNGTISADGAAPASGVDSHAPGGGAGGSINITATTLSGSTGSLSADGGNGHNGASYDGGGGGGGRIAVNAGNLSSFLSGLTAATTTVQGAGTDAASNGAIGTLYLNVTSIPSQPSISAPADAFQNQSINPTLTSSAYSSDGAAHTTSDWKVATDSSGSNVVWYANDDATHKTSITVNSSQGTFTGALSGQTALNYNTTYYVFVRHTNSIGDSSWSATGHDFTTLLGVSVGGYTWGFDTAGDYNYNDSYLDVASSLASLDDLGGSTYIAGGLLDFAYRKPITVTNNEAFELTNYQVRVNVSYDAHMQADFDDLRFTSSNGGTEIDYWIETYTASTAAIVWVEVPSIPASSSTTVYMYYGNAGVSTTSNDEKTFLVSDDFSGGSLDGEWTEITLNGGAAGTIADGAWTKTCDGECDWWSSNSIDAGVYMGDPATSIEWEAITYLSSANVGGNRHVGMMLYQGATDGYMWGPKVGTTTFTGELTGGTPSCSLGSGSVPAYLKIQKTSSNGLGSNDTYAFWRSTDGATWSQCATLTPNDIMDNVGLFIKDWTTGSTSATFDFFFVKKYTANAPSVSVGNESVVSFANIAITPISGLNYAHLTTFTETLGGGNAGNLAYQVSNNGTNWYYHNGTTWIAATIDSAHNNTAAEVNGYLPSFVTDVGTGTLFFKAFLLSNTSQAVQLDSLSVGYDGGNPTGLTDFAFSSGTATTATLTWTAASDDSFDHYEIWYGANQSDVQNRTGTATEWDNGNDVNLATRTTTTTTITGLTAGVTYYAKIWAVDAFSQEMTIADINFTTNQAPGINSVSASQNSSGVALSFVLSDADADSLSAKIEYSVDNEASWEDPTLSSLTVSNGSATLNNASDYQISSVSTSSANTVTVLWNAGTDESNIDIANAKIRITTTDAIATTGPTASSGFALDLAAPTGLTALTLGSSSNTQTSLAWTAVSDTNFDRYEIYYDGTDASVSVKSGNKLDSNTYSELATLSTHSLTISGNVQGFYFKIYAFDSFGNEATVDSLYVTPSSDVGGVGFTGGGSSGSGSSSSSGSSSGSSTSDDTSEEDATIDETTPEPIVITTVDELISTDTDVHWAKAYIEYLVDDDQIIDAAAQVESFFDLMVELFITPDDAISRAEATQFLLTMNGIPSVNIQSFNAFTDLDETSLRGEYVQYAFEQGLVNGFPDGSFRLNQALNRAEALKMAMTFFGESVDPNLKGTELLAAYGLEASPFSDVDLDAWYAPYIIQSYVSGVIRGYEDGTVRPSQSVTYAEFIKISVLAENLSEAVNLASELDL